MKRTPVIVNSKKKIVRTPVLCGSGRKKRVKIKRQPVIWPLVISYKDPSDDPEGFEKAIGSETQKILDEFFDLISTEAGWIENLTETATPIGFQQTKLYPYQIEHMNNHSKYRWINKSRQIGFSYGASAESLAKCHLMDHYTSIFVSYNQEEANEKINYARAMYESVPLKYQRKLKVDRVTALEFEKRTGSRRTCTRLISHPQRAVRGKGGNVDVLLDEFAHFTWDVKIYVAAVPVITRGFGQITVASSPLGRMGLHWQIGEDKVRYPAYSRQQIPWFSCYDFLNSESKENFKKVQRVAPKLTTEERVLAFGNEAIVQAYYSSHLEDFQQEYELRPFDERESYYSLRLIKSCTFEALRGEIQIEEDDVYGDSPKQLGPVYKGLEYKTFDSFDSLSRAIGRGEVSRHLYAGYDVGRYENASELYIIEELRDYDNFQMLRHFFSGRNIEFEAQQNLLKKMFKVLPVKKLLIDATGLGKQLGEYMKKYYRSRVECLDFNMSNKQDMATNLKIRMEEQLIGYPSDKDLIRQIHSIKREISAANQVRFIAEEDKTHHGDKYWALAMASYGGTPMKILKGTHRVTVDKITNSANIIQLSSHRKFPKNRDAFVLPTGIQKPPLHVDSLGATIIDLRRLA